MFRGQARLGAYWKVVSLLLITMSPGGSSRRELGDFTYRRVG
jgi:hypothetical protein